MRLSPKTVAALATLNAINPRLLIKPGAVLSTVSPSGKVTAIFHVSETFPKEASIADLGKIVSVLKHMPGAEFIMDERHIEMIDPTLGTARVVNAFAVSTRGTPNEKSILAAPVLTEFLLRKEQLALVLQMQNAVGAGNICIWGDGKKVRIGAATGALRSCDMFSSPDLADTSETFSLTFVGEVFQLLMKTDHTVRVLKTGAHIVIIAPDDYYIMVLAAERTDQ